jgi:16S rRNA (uracil1498-N3)-methyltransferase
MAAPRFLLRTLPVAGETAWLDRDEARHAVGSRRLGEGDVVELVDGRGGVATARLGRERDRDGDLGAVVERVERLARPAPALHVGSAVPKGDRLSTLLDAVGELAVHSLTPLACERSVTPPDKLAGDRTTRILTEAMKQSRGAWLTDVHAPMSPLDFARASVQAGHCTLLLDAAGAPLATLAARHASIAFIVGPEGGFSDAEREQLIAAGATPASLGATVLRVELAVAVACGAVRALA